MLEAITVRLADDAKDTLVLNIVFEDILDGEEVRADNLMDVNEATDSDDKWDNEDEDMEVDEY